MNGALAVDPYTQRMMEAIASQPELASLGGFMGGELFETPYGEVVQAGPLGVPAMERPPPQPSFWDRALAYGAQGFGGLSDMPMDAFMGAPLGIAPPPVLSYMPYTPGAGALSWDLFL